MTGSDPRRIYGEGEMKAIVLFDTRYGNTEKVARALANGLEEAGVGSTCCNISVAGAMDLGEYDLIAVGGPTQYRTASLPMQEFLASLDGKDFHGQMAFAFDTRKDSFWAGSAAKYIEGKLVSRGLRMVWPPLSAVVFIPQESEERGAGLTKEELKERRRRTVRLAGKMEELFRKTGREIGKTLSTAPSHPDA
jgi:flavorubredoxin